MQFSLVLSLLVVGAIAKPSPGTGDLDQCSHIKCSIGSHCENGECVPDAVTENPCTWIKCSLGYHCDVVDGQGGCFPDLDQCTRIKCRIGSHCENGHCVPDAVTENPCTWIKCSLGYHCAVVNGGGGCVPDLDQCIHIKCSLGSHCENGQCVSDLGPIDPCDSMICETGSTCVVENGAGVCIPDGTPINPCIIMQCPTGEKCIFTNGPPTCVPDTPLVGSI